MTPAPDSPTFVFGGATNEVTSIAILIGDEQIDVELIHVPEHGWNLSFADLPSQWAVAGPLNAKVVTFDDGIEVQRLPLQSVSG